MRMRYKAGIYDHRGRSCPQALPSLPVQALTLASWCASRVILYSSFYAIVGAIFGFRTFGTIIGAISTVTVGTDSNCPVVESTFA